MLDCEISYDRALSIQDILTYEYIKLTLLKGRHKKADPIMGGICAGRVGEYLSSIFLCWYIMYNWSV